MKKGACVHYSGDVFRRGECDKGVNVRDLVGGDALGWLARTPCFTRHETDITCEYFSEPTEQQIKDAEKGWDVLIKRMTLVNPVISKLKEKYAETGGNEIVECPVCKGRLHCSVSSLNGHVHGRCETDDCLCWME